MAGGMVTVWYACQMDRLLTAVTEENIASFKTAEALEIGLVNQKGFVSYYFIEGLGRIPLNGLGKLGEFHQVFKERLK